MANSPHQASAQMLGYLYQVRCALDLLLSDTNERLSICLEKFDDVAFSTDGATPAALIQTKHHVAGRGDLSDKSTDLWRTLKVWIDYIEERGLDNIKFIIVTTATSPEDSAASLLRGSKRDATRAYELLKAVSSDSQNKTNVPFYTAFGKTSAEKMMKLLDNVTVIDMHDNIVDVAHNIKATLRYSARPESIENVFERVEGWWFDKIIIALTSNEPIFITQDEVHSRIRDIADEYSSNNLPIDIVLQEIVDIENVPEDERVFCEQLYLIAVKETRLQLAIRDYYNAFTQRSKWVKDENLYIDELSKYENSLIGEWQRLFAQMEDEITAEQGDAEKQKAGRDLYNAVSNMTHLSIRPKCTDAFVMRGSYHILANALRVGWHLEYKKMLSSKSDDGGVQ
ncbi:hypothetical protein FACS1894208_08580 [Clostridia bacterium]|nr:hypothetical protein FACS1894208_08580 [Clostridia bacterium]